jgi:rubrerythrin
MLDDLEAPDRGQPRSFMSARDAVMVALRSEEKAWTFFDEALKVVKDPQVAALFRELRSEEAAHEQLLTLRLARLPPGPDVTEEEADQPGSDGG